jgi:hypothetical protein
MGRPTLDDEVLERLEAVVDRRTKVPAEHLTTAQRLDFVLDALGEADSRIEYLSDRVDDLEEELEEARAEAEEDDLDLDGLGGVGNINQGNRRNQF